MNTPMSLALAIAALALAAPVQAQTPASDHSAHSAHSAAPAGGAPGAARDAIDGEVRKVDPEARKITLRHGPIAAFDMPGMTMVFQVRDPRMLDGLKTGDKVRFKVDKIDGQYTVTELAPAR